MEIVSVDITNCMFFVVHVYQALCSTYDLRWIILEFCGFTNLSTSPTTSGGSIFRCTTKDRGERRAKGLQSRPLDSGFLYGGMRGDVLTPYEFALVHFTRFRLVRWRAGGVRFARLRRKAKHRLFAAISLPQALVPPDSCLLLQLR